jgi:NAD-dependent dihydropyrimidine dehydrogenase PreA subunit
MATSITKIDLTRCDGCQTCYDLCPQDVYTWDEEKDRPRVAYPEECWACGVCWAECPRRAISYTIPASLW